MLEIRLIPEREFRRIVSADSDRYSKLTLIADMCRANALATVKRAGSGHLGSSFSSLDIVTFLYHSEMNVIELGMDHCDRDIYFSSKGHDAPGHYSVLYSLAIITQELFINLRRFGGTHGHPDVNIPGIEANSGSLGMGISKAKGMALAKKIKGEGGRVFVMTGDGELQELFINLRRFGGTHGHPDVKIPGIEANSGSLGMGISKAKGMALAKKIKGEGGRVFVMTGDGELQEGQIWESLQTTAHQNINNVHVIVDFNKIQSDKSTESIISLGNLENKFKAFGWEVQRCDGHDFDSLARVFDGFKKVQDRPKVLIADTVKGKGVSFMEGPFALKNGQGLYKWHAGAPDDDAFEAGYCEIIERINTRLKASGLEPLHTEIIEEREKNRKRLKDTAEKVVHAYGEALVEMGARRNDLIVLDADLSADCGLRPFENKFPERFVENGIAEQDMVSTAGGLALQGFLPIVNSFGVFLASRANEQIYNNATENTKIIYVCHYAGLIPAGPGKSHQSIRDISLFGALPNCVIIEPCNGLETRHALEWCVNEAEQSCMMRLVISPSPSTMMLPEEYQFSYGRGSVLKEGRNALLFSYGPVMLHEALRASELLENHGCSLKVVNLPWLNRIDLKWLENIVGDYETIFSLDNHSPYGGLGDCLLNTAAESDTARHKRFIKFAVEDHPVCGTPPEALAYHRLDAGSLADRILRTLSA